MTIDFTCRKCEGSFEIEADDLIAGTEKLVCPHCDAKAPVAMVDDFTSAVVELRTQVATMSKKFAVSLAIETEDVEVEEEEEEEDESEDSEDDDELDFDEDEEDGDDEDDLEDEDLDDER
jgi:hypothetical protein